MYNRKSFVILLAIVLFFAVGLQLLRSNILLSLFKNVNLTLSTKAYESVEIPIEISKEKYLVIFDSKEPNSISVKDNIVKTLKYMKKDVEIVKVDEVNTFKNTNKAVILTFEKLNQLSNMNMVMDYVNNGGNLFFAERPLVDTSLLSIYNKLGINQLDGIVTSKGMKLITNVLIQGSGLSINENIVQNSSLKVDLNQSAELMATSQENLPLLWKSSCGNGNIIMFNGTSLNEKINRGIVTGAISLLIPDCIYPIMNTKLTYIDDFPSPVPGGYNKDIYKEYGLNISQFYRDIWWTDILKGSRLYNLKYTGTIIENYTNSTTPPFKNNKNAAADLTLYGRELLRNGGELGIHGYNHQSLAQVDYIKQSLGYTPWNSISDMEKSIFEVSRYAKTVYPSYTFRVYVPPSNILSPQGKEAIIKALPDLKIISSIYVNHYLGDSYSQEFEIKDGISELPRLTFGYINDDETKWNAYNGITSLGVFSHFIHPDDALDSRRNNNMNWSELIKEYNSLLSQINNKFPWLKPVTASEGSDCLRDYININPVMEYKSDRINVYCKNFKENSPFILRSNKKIYADKGFDVSSIDSGVYLITAKKPSFTIIIK